jgi:hypothetical protein
VPDPSTQRVDYQIFSDTIIFFTKDDSLKSFFDIIGTAKGLLTFNFAGMIPAPYRGAIGYGDILTSLQSLIGTSIIDAYYGEQKQVWSGCMFTKKCETFCNSQNYFEILSKTFEQRSKDAVDTREKNIMKELESIVIQYEVPLQKKSGLNIEYYNEKHYVINWTHWVGEGRHIEQSFQESNILHHKKIKDNTIQFSKYAREKYKLN